jgi:hypothetical protein
MLYEIAEKEEEETIVGAQEYDLIGKTKSLKKSVSFQYRLVARDVQDDGDQVVG